MITRLVTLFYSQISMTFFTFDIYVFKQIAVLNIIVNVILQIMLKYVPSAGIVDTKQSYKFPDHILFTVSIVLHGSKMGRCLHLFQSI